LTDTVILLKDPKIKSCRFEIGNVDGIPKLGYVIYPQNLRPGALQVPAGVGIAGPVFSE
jgi:hypothetical protein